MKKILFLFLIVFGLASSLFALDLPKIGGGWTGVQDIKSIALIPVTSNDIVIPKEWPPTLVIGFLCRLTPITQRKDVDYVSLNIKKGLACGHSAMGWSRG